MLNMLNPRERSVIVKDIRQANSRLCELQNELRLRDQKDKEEFERFLQEHKSTTDYEISESGSGFNF